jgi:hypothetical protein
MDCHSPNQDHRSVKIVRLQFHPEGDESKQKGRLFRRHVFIVINLIWHAEM